jgi:hypothetical protein
LIILRVFRIRKLDKVVKLIEDQEKYKLFEKNNLVLKWCRSSDYSTLIIEIVEKYQEEDWFPKKTITDMQWFPATFPIIGKGEYNKPLKLEIKDPHLVKLIDHLKDLILCDDSFLKTFKIPDF